MKGKKKKIKKTLIVALVLLVVTLTGIGLMARAGLPEHEDKKDANATADTPSPEEVLEREITFFRNAIPPLETAIHVETNHAREMAGLPPLEWDPELSAIAKSYSRDMATRRFFSHINPEGENFKARYEKAGYKKATRVGDTIYFGGENIFRDSIISSSLFLGRSKKKVLEHNIKPWEKIVSEIVEGWLKSEEHKTNILSPNFSREGIGIEINEDGEIYIVQNFS